MKTAIRLSVIISGILYSASLMAQEVIIDKEIRYKAPHAGSVYIVWGVNGWQQADSIFWSENTKVLDKILYTPMIKQGDIFTVTLSLPKDIVLDYTFWVTENDKGHFQDIWDYKGNRHARFTDNKPIEVNATLIPENRDRPISLLTSGWILLIITSAFFAITLGVEHIFPVGKKSASIYVQIILSALSLYLFHTLIRSEIISIHPTAFLTHPNTAGALVAASRQDLGYVSMLTIFFLVLAVFVKKPCSKQICYIVFILLAMLSLSIALLNISIVLQIGHPFTYQWLYYSDFLGSTVAKSAIGENISASLFINIIAICAAMWFLAQSFIKIYKRVIARRFIKYVMAISISLLIGFLAFYAIKPATKWESGKLKHPVTAFVFSLFQSLSNPSFFDMPLPEDQRRFFPTQKLIVDEESHLLPQVKNVILIVLESAGAAYFDTFGGSYAITPNLVKYEKNALIFENFYAHAPATNKSMVAILCSMYPWISYKTLTAEHPAFRCSSLSSVLKKEGYRTSFFSSADLSFQHSDEFLSNRDFDVVEDFSEIPCDHQFYIDDDNYREGNGMDDRCLAGRLENWLDQAPEENFFTMIWTMQAHYPYFNTQEGIDYGVNHPYLNRYLNALKTDDELIGMIMKNLEKRDLTESTLVIVVGDHGEAFGSHNQYGHGSFIYEENLRIPLFFINPLLFHGERKQDIGALKDIAPSVLGILGVEIPENWQGRNLLTTENDKAFFFVPWSDYLFGYREGNMKYIFNETDRTVEVYNLEEDPHELDNLYNMDMEENLNEVRMKLAAWVQYQDQFIRNIIDDKRSE